MYFALATLAKCVLFFIMHECVAGMLTYSASELYRLRQNDVTVTRSIRKTIFSHCLWCPRRMRELHHELQQASTQCIWPPSVVKHVHSIEIETAVRLDNPLIVYETIVVDSTFKLSTSGA
jgi:hypothetical protein